jgi:3-oxoacid CoA-transferase
VQTGELPVRFNGDGSPALMTKARETRNFRGKNYVMEESIFGDVAVVKVHKADRLGNCTFRKAQNNFNEVMAKNAKMTIVEADEIVEVGELQPEQINIQGIYVDAVIQSTEPKKIEKLTFAKDAQQIVKGEMKPCSFVLSLSFFLVLMIRVTAFSSDLTPPLLYVHDLSLTLKPVETASSIKRERIIRRAAKELKDGMYVNLGIGIPLATPALVPEGIEVILQSENGILGMGRYPKPGEEDPDLINPGKETVTLNSGASVFGSHESFGMIRAGRINLTMLGALQVSMYGGKLGLQGALMPAISDAKH